MVGQGYIIRQQQTAGDFVSFSYTEGSSHTQASELGLGISGYGVEAGYQGAGSDASTATRTEGFPDEHGNAWFRTEFSTGQFRGICYGPPGNTFRGLSSTVSARARTWRPTCTSACG